MTGARQAATAERTGRALLALASVFCVAAFVAPAGADAAWPGQNGEIVFQAFHLSGEEAAYDEGRGIWSSLPDAPNGQVHRLTIDHGDTAPQVSPDGRWVVFSRQRPSTTTTPAAGAIFRMRSDGAAVTRLTDGTHLDRQPAFLASGERVVFSRDDEGGNLYSVALDGSGLHQITSGPAEDRRPAVSPSGRVIAFERNNEIFTARPSGASLRNATRQIQKKTAKTAPDFSPDGKRIAFAFEGRIYTMAASGGHLRQISGFHFPTTGMGEPSFAPDGRSLLAVYTSPYRSSSLYLFPLRAGVPRACGVIHTGAEQARSPVWQPSSQAAAACREH
jgi:dipeptidyl aminopeptidase/acylaminoacyl peptidase